MMKPGIVIGKAFARVAEIEEGVAAPSPEIIQKLEAILQHQVAQRVEWPDLYGKAYPRSYEEWIALAYEAGVQFQRTIDSLTLHELEPLVRAYLNGLRERRLANGIQKPAIADSIAAPTVFAPNAERDKWLYDQAIKGTAWKSIVAELAKIPEWERIESIQGVRSAVKRYAEAQNLPQVPARQRGARSN